ncbi:MAG: IS4 family transposase [Gammaproteobacteria bacterium]|nr:IS4 family transposase [Gammaproteobacteria bacterium]
MKVKTILNNLLKDVTPEMHKIRRKSLNALVLSLISGADLSVTSLGRNINSKTTEKHQIKRSTRLCSNPHLHHEIKGIYSKLSLRLIGEQKHPVILVDWSDLDPRKQHFLLRAAVAVDGRSLTLLEEIHPLSSKEKPETHKQFMEHLKSILPDNCRPVIVTDAGFRVPWFKLVQSLGWDYVGRVRNRTFCKNTHDADWHPVKDLYQQATATAKKVGCYGMCRRDPIYSQMVVYKAKKKGRKDMTANGKSARNSKRSRSNAAREREPWLLATSLSSTDKSRFAKKIVKIYRTRMQIEESFRDVKTGLNFNRGDTRKAKRLGVLLLVALLTQFVLFLLGMVVKILNKHRQYQANTVTSKNVLSYQFLGLRAFKDRRLKLSKNDWARGYNKIQQIIGESSYA